MPFAPRIAIIGFAPAGGWTVFVAIIKKMANPTANPKLTNEEPSIEKINTPAKADNICPNPLIVWTNKRNSKSRYLKKRKDQIKKKSMFLSDSEKVKIKEIYKENKKLNQIAGFNKFHVDHIIPLSKGGNHHPENLRIISAEENLRKGSN